MLAFLKALILLPVALVLILLAVANRQPVLLSLDPFAKGAPEIAVTLPLFALLFGALLVGVVLGGCGAWMAAGSDRRARRYSAREVNRLKGEADRLRASLATDGRPGLPATRPTY